MRLAVEIGLGLIHGVLVIARIDNEKHVALVDNLIVGDAQLHHRAADLRRDVTVSARTRPSRVQGEIM